MVKEFAKRFTIGTLIGIAIGQIMAIIMSLASRSDKLLLVSRELVESSGSEVKAVIIFTIGMAVLGGIFSASSVFFDVMDASIVKQSIIHFLVTTPVFAVVAFVLKWLTNTSSLIPMIIIYLSIYVFWWIVYFLYWKLKISKLNKAL